MNSDEIVDNWMRARRSYERDRYWPWLVIAGTLASLLWLIWLVWK